jgi:hypothetical protein
MIHHQRHRIRAIYNTVVIVARQYNAIIIACCYILSQAARLIDRLVGEQLVVCACVYVFDFVMALEMDVDLENVVQADLEAVKEFTKKYPQFFGPGRPARLIYGIPYRNVSNSRYTGPRKVSEETMTSPIGKYYDPALQLRESEINANLLNTKLRLQHDGENVDGRFLGYKIVNGRVHALILLHTDTPERSAIADNIGPDKKYNGLSVAMKHDTIGKNGNIVAGPASIPHVAITDKPFYNTYIYMAASRDAVKAEVDNAKTGMRLLQ